MSSRPAQYLLRFDDLCPTVSRVRWQRFLPLIREFGIKPILAVVPDNQDHWLVLSPPDRGFWEEMRGLEAEGATIALHGYQHLCVTRGRSLVPLHQETEFAGAPEQQQRQWIQKGLEILRGHGLSPRVWVAPRHGFDRATLRVLKGEGIRLVSDGFARQPFTRGGLTWIPQQLWGPVEKPLGLWTICLHTNAAPDALVRQLGVFLGRHGAQFTSVDRVLAEWPAAPLPLAEGIWGTGAMVRMRIARIRQRLFPRH